ncbi:hypothetical protein AGMMS50289_16420 [Betaproteobacteria bacterium]|nr:hypothetical protein AGMMS50289_16420 [Betaproteobacteria bacterium]
MTAVTFDTLQLVKDLEASGIKTQQAEAINKALKNVMTTAEVATKHDLKELESKVDIRMAELNAEMKMIKWMSGATMAGVISIIMKTFF